MKTRKQKHPDKFLIDTSIDPYDNGKPQHTPTPWDIGRTLITAQTKRWTAEAVQANDFHENRMIFADFKFSDEGRSRRLIAKCENFEDAAFIVRAVNSHEELLGELKSLVAWVEEDEARAESLERQLNNAKAAIAKAEGK